MHKSITIIVAILVAGGLVAYYLHLEHNRYEIKTTSKGIAYEVDKKTGNSWMLRGKMKVAQEIPIPPEQLLDEEKAIELAKRAKTLNDYTNNEFMVKKWM